MSPELSAQSAEESPVDQALDAEVVEVHPALQPQPHYPYAAPGPNDSMLAARTASLGSTFWSGQQRDTGQAPLGFLTSPAEYFVPQRFGMSAILGITTALAVLFGALRLMNAFPIIYLFFGVQAIVICLVQMFYGKTPRAASAIAGAIILPVFMLLTFTFSNNVPPIGAIIAMLLFCVPTGGFLGYLTGTCAAGVFLLMDLAEPLIKGELPSASHVHSP